MAQQDSFHKSFIKQLDHVNERTFKNMAIELFRYQIDNNPIYHKYTRYLGIRPGNITSLEKIPFIPVQFFKNHLVQTGQWKPELHFTSSGTTGSMPSRHPVRNLGDYLTNTERIFTEAYGDPEAYHIFGLLPSYLERTGSSLITMVEHLHKESQSDLGGFFLYNHEDLISGIRQARTEGTRKILLIGVTYALLDLAKKGPLDLSDCILMETGGMKGRRKEMTREEVHDQLKAAFGVAHVHSEYGMTEMFSQAYSKGNGIYTCSRTMRVLLRDPNDPLDVSENRTHGVINIIDLANSHSCAFLATDDLGVLENNLEFRVLGRIDNSDIRGCNLMVG